MSLMTDVDEKLLQPYAPNETEKRIYTQWLESGFFNPDNLPERHQKPFTILMPPINANGSLHAGHGLVMTIEDIIVRYKRMRGHKALWLPGLDHAGFETQVVYEKILEKEGRSRFSVEPQELYREILEFTLTNSKNIRTQIQSMGASCDWSREKFTLDKDIIKTVYTTFEKLYRDNLLYRGKRIVSWCPKHGTSFSDLEILDETRTDPLYYLKYGPFTIATARPETKFGDKYVVMHPDDARYAQYKNGESINLEWINGPIKATIIKDTAIDMEFGTGVMTITPWHDATDFDIAERHNLLKEQIIDEKGKLLAIAQEFAGMHISKARPLIAEKLKTKNLILKIDESYTHNVHTCYKCGTLIEPQIKSQWFVRMKPLAERALQKIKNGEIRYIPEQYEKISAHWLENITDWNISRQIVWGIPIPAKICDTCDLGFLDRNDKLNTCEKCGTALRKDTDTFDTWFSSGQWPFVALSFPEGADFKTYYPAQVMETAGEIIFFWVSRMIMLGLYVTDHIPFEIVYLHGLVLDAKGRKMSKSKGNVINPLLLTEKYGTDAFRMGLVIGNTPGTSLSLSEDKIRGYKHFANKIWNVARFVLTHEKECSAATMASHKKEASSEKDLKILAELRKCAREVTEDIEHYRLHIAAEKLYHYFWHTFADKIIEETKPRLIAGGENAESASRMLRTSLETLIALLHPFMPFITEEIWTLLHKNAAPNSLLLVSPWPVD